MLHTFAHIQLLFPNDTINPLISSIFFFSSLLYQYCCFFFFFFFQFFFFASSSSFGLSHIHSFIAIQYNCYMNIFFPLPHSLLSSFFPAIFLRANFWLFSLCYQSFFIVLCALFSLFSLSWTKFPFRSNALWAHFGFINDFLIRLSWSFSIFDFPGIFPYFQLLISPRIPILSAIHTHHAFIQFIKERK